MSNIERMRKKGNESTKQFVDTITEFSFSQGFYGRLCRDVEELDESGVDELIEELDKQDFRTSLDVVLYLEQ